MNTKHPYSVSDKFIREHTASLKDIIFSRREFLEKTGMGFGALSLASIFGLTGGALGATESTSKAITPLSPKQPHFKAKAKAVIHLFAAGAPSHVDTWAPKPELTKYNDKTIPGHDGLAFGSPFQFNKMGKSGIEVSEVFPKLGECVDDMAIIRSLWTDVPAHEVASRFMHTGSLQLPKPSMGSWTVYGLGTE